MKSFLAAVLACTGFAAFAQTVNPPPIAARAFVLVDVQSGQTLATAGERDRYDPASLTKLMTAYLVFGMIRDHKLDPAQAVAVSQRAAKVGGSRMFIEERTPVTVEELLQGLVVQSGNDAAVALAEAAAGSEEAFVQLMNRQAERLGLAGTKFANASGEPGPDHYSTARDLASLALAVLRDFPEQYRRYSVKEYTYNGIRQSNRNRLLWTDPSVDGMKTGFTETAGYCLVASARRGERRLLSVVLGTQSETLRATESQKLLNFGFQAYETRRLYKRGDVVAMPEVYKGTSSNAKLGFDHDVWLTLPRGRFDGVKGTLEMRKPFVAPLAAGQKAGIMKFARDDAPVAEFPVVAIEDVPVAGFLSRGWDTLRLLVQ